MSEALGAVRASVQTSQKSSKRGSRRMSHNDDALLQMMHEVMQARELSGEREDYYGDEFYEPDFDPFNGSAFPQNNAFMDFDDDDDDGHYAEDDDDVDGFVNDDDDEDDDSNRVDLSDFCSQAWQRVYQNYVCSLGSTNHPATVFLTESEMHLQAQNYRQALICALATERIDTSQSAEMRRDMINAVCLYQLGDKRQASHHKEKVFARLENQFGLSEGVEGVEQLIEDHSSEDGNLSTDLKLSIVLLQKFKGTCEVLCLMPELLQMLKKMGK